MGFRTQRIDIFTIVLGVITLIFEPVGAFVDPDLAFELLEEKIYGRN